MHPPASFPREAAPHYSRTLWGWALSRHEERKSALTGPVSQELGIPRQRKMRLKGHRASAHTKARQQVMGNA